MPTKKKTKKPSVKKPIVTRAFMLKLADKIHNPKTKTFLRLCAGHLKNGPDPTDKARAMHCGLGELYFEMMGKHPTVGTTENHVVYTAVGLAGLRGIARMARKTALANIEGLGLTKYVTNVLVESLQCLEDHYFDGREANFRAILDRIPDANDYAQGPGGPGCSTSDYVARSRRVAKLFREAAKFLD